MSTHGDRNAIAVMILAILAWLLFPACSTNVQTDVRVIEEDHKTTRTK